MSKFDNDWKACKRQKRFPSSNLGHSASTPHLTGFWDVLPKGIKTAQTDAFGIKKTANKPQRMRKVRVSLYYGRSFDKNGTAPLLLAVNHASSSCYIPLPGIRLTRNQWDVKRKRVVNHPQAGTINSVAAANLGKANEAIMHLGNVRGLTTAQVRDLVAAYIFPEAAKDTSFMGVMRNYTDMCDRPNTADKFKQTATHIRRWLGAQKAQRLQFSDINPDWLAQFDRHLITTCPSVSSRGIHLRNIRTIFNYALDHNLTAAPYPFRAYKIKTAPSNPQPLTLEQMRLLWCYSPKSEVQSYWLDMWRLMFALIGINIVDLASLAAISQGRINYTRRKTGRLYSVKVEPVASEYIRRHRGRATLLDILDRYKSVHVATSQCNKHLKEIANDLGMPPITTYTSRYTWATLALSIDTPIEVISQALGHSYGQAVTLGYIMPDRRKVDEANRKVLELVTKQ